VIGREDGWLEVWDVDEEGRPQKARFLSTQKGFAAAEPLQNHFMPGCSRDSSYGRGLERICLLL
jgi:hypothetical protein